MGPQGGVGGGGAEGWSSVDVQPRDCDPSDLARRAANVSELISASPAELTLWNQAEAPENTP